ncbi:MAG: HK97 gp10 family phage protein [Rhodoblastus sp.]
MPFEIVVNDRMQTAQLDRLGPDVRTALERKLRPIAEAMAGDARSRAEAHIRFLGVKPGAYVASIKGGVASKDRRVVGYVRSGSPLAHLLEYGAQTPPHVIEASVKEAMAFAGPAGRIFAAKVNHPGAAIPAYPAIGPAFAARRDEIRGAIESALDDTVKRTF